ncbi:MAG: hypothetical protein AAGC64_00845 [Bacteroidota bacterium]
MRIFYIFKIILSNSETTKEVLSNGLNVVNKETNSFHYLDFFTINENELFWKKNAIERKADDILAAYVFFYKRKNSKDSL